MQKTSRNSYCSVASSVSLGLQPDTVTEAEALGGEVIVIVIHRVSKKLCKLIFLSELCQILTDCKSFGQND